MQDQKSNIVKKQIQLKELQNKLPIEIKGKKDQSFSFKDWSMEEEKQIAKIKEKNPSMGRFVSSVLCLMLKDLHGEPFNSKEDKEKILTINQMPMGNILYMYIYLRYDQMGSELRLDFDCPFCANKIRNFTATLDDIDVDCKVGDYEDLIEYKLKKPVTLDKGDQLIEKVKIGLSPWDIMERAESSGSFDEATMKQHTFRYSIKEIVGVTGHVVDEFMKKLKKIDIEFLHKTISEHNAGPNLQAEVECSKCKQTAYKSINWGYDDFFGIGSLPQI